MNLSKNTFLAFLTALFAIVINAPAQSVVVNKYQVEPDTVELLVVQSNLDLRGMIIKDFSNTLANDNGGRYQFSQNSLWSSVPSGTLIVLRSNATAADTNFSDYVLDVGFTNPTYFANLGGSFDISTTDMVMIKAAGTGASGVAGSIHALASGSTMGAQFTNAPPPKLFASSSTLAGTFAFATNPNSTLADFNGSSATGNASGLTFGSGNNSTNTAFINSLRNSFIGEPTTNASNLTFISTGATALNLQWTNGNGARRIVLARQGGAVNAVPADGASYAANASFGAGAQIGAGNFVVFNGGDAGVTVTDLAPNTTYHFAVFERNGTDATSDYLTVAPAINNATTAAAFTITGRVTSSNGTALNGVSVTLTGDTTPRTAVTDANGNYVFSNVTANRNYVVSVADAAGFTAAPATATLHNLDSARTANFTLTSNLLISEYRFRGSDPDDGGSLNGATNEFVELHNRTGGAINLGGFSLVLSPDSSAPQVLHTFANGTLLPSRARFLIGGSSYEPLTSEAQADVILASTIDIPDNARISVFNNSSNFNSGTQLDSVASLTPNGISINAEHSYLRRVLANGELQDTDVDSNDITLVAPHDITFDGLQVTLGIPAAQGTRAATNALSSMLSFTSSDVNASAITSRFRRGRAANKITNGTLVFQRTITNTGTFPISLLRLRVIDITTRGTRNTGDNRNADVRVLSSSDNGSARGLTLEEPPAQSAGGGLNSGLIVNGINSQTPLNTGASITLEFRLSVVKAGIFRFAVMPEALTVALTSANENLVMGNPSNAVTDINQPTNYLLDKAQFAASYHRDNGTPNWVSWHLDSSWIGTSGRSDDFAPDTTLPAGWYRVQPSDYSNSGYTRGHMSPSGDRTRSLADNRAVFLMTNMIPQTAANNNTTWNNLEVYCRELVAQGNELYIISGGAGNIGTLNNANRVVIPDSTWKVIIVLPVGNGNDAARVTTGTRTIAVNVPNTNSVNADWRTYRTTVDSIEALTNFDFFSNVPQSVQSVIEATVDNQ